MDMQDTIKMLQQAWEGPLPPGWSAQNPQQSSRSGFGDSQDASSTASANNNKRIARAEHPTPPIPPNTLPKVFIPGLVKEVYTAGSRHDHDGPLTLTKSNVTDGKRVSFEWTAEGSRRYSVTAEGVVEIMRWSCSGPIFDRTKFSVECSCPDGDRQYERNAESDDELYVCKHAKAALDSVCDPNMTEKFPTLLAKNKQLQEQERTQRNRYLQAQREEQEQAPGERERIEYGLSKRSDEEIAELVKERLKTAEGLAALCKLFPSNILPPKKLILCGRCNEMYDPQIKSDLICRQKHPHDRVDEHETFDQCLRCYKTFNLTSDIHCATACGNKRRRRDAIREEGDFCYVATHVPHDVYDKNNDPILASLGVAISMASHNYTIPPPSLEPPLNGGDNGASGSPIDGIFQEESTDLVGEPPVAPTAEVGDLPTESIQPSNNNPLLPRVPPEPAAPTSNEGPSAVPDASIVQEKPTHPLAGAKHRKNSTDEDVKAQYRSYLQYLCGRNCFNASSKRKTQCTCMISIKDDDSRLQGCVDFLLQHGMKSKQERDTKVMGMIRMNTGLSNKSKSPLPVLGSNTDPYLICRNALQQILFVQKGAWAKLVGYVKDGLYEAPYHHLKGKTGEQANRSLNADLTASLHSYFKSLEGLASPRATALVRTETGVEVRDSDIELLELPASMSKRGLYKRYLHTRGQDIDTDAKGRMTYKVLDGKVPQSYVSWCAFRSFWKTNYSKLRKFVSEEEQDILCPDPGLESIERNKNNIKKRKALSAATKRAAKKIAVSPSSLSSNNTSPTSLLPSPGSSL